MFTKYSLDAAIKDLQLEGYAYILRRDVDDFARALRLKGIPFTTSPCADKQYLRFDLEV